MVLDYSGIIEAVKKGDHPAAPVGVPFQQTCVFMLLCQPESPYILFILKADREGYPWRNQMALPGGHIDDDDPSPLKAAYRELEEELGIDNKDVDFIGSIGHYQTIKNKVIEAFLGLWNEKGIVRFDTKEIARVVKIPVEVLYQTHIKKNFREHLPGYDELLYPFDDIVVWGATARIVHYFMNLIIPYVKP